MPKIIKPPIIPDTPPVLSFKEDLNQNHDPDEYKRSGTDSGLLVIFNQLSYEDESYEFRKGTNQDVNELILTFGRLGFNVDEKYIFNNLDRGSFLNVIKNVSQEDHSHRNCLVIVVLTHGEQHNELQAQDAPIFAYEIWEPFFNSACASFRNKPKFFIFQACKGKNCSTSDSNAGTIVSETIFQKPLESDMLIAFSCVEGAKSTRNLRKEEKTLFHYYCACQNALPTITTTS
ncbi:hypothetical protein RN001_015516 [Aquatica leii]|uniref:Caspase family p20 domain-containing protein n=1 Tax=Aquatica leii TaxID=1421715 RepID=A0AAN7PQX4_9COLE|nr:hypothetical protein RN001_015516 [Aquatica leii]